MAPLATPLQDMPAAGGHDLPACPRCGQELVDPFGLGWCKTCGFCRSLGESGTHAAAAATAPAPTPSRVVATGAAVGRLPLWFWLTLLSAVALALGAYAVNRYVPLKPLPRAQWTTLQIGVGVALMGIAQFLALMRLAPEEPTLNFSDALMPMRLYGLIAKHLPRTRWMLLTICCGATLIVSALVFIGGLEHWFQYLPKGR